MIAVTIHGPPGPAKANSSKTPIVRRGHASMVSTKSYRLWRAKAVDAILKVAGEATLDGPLWINVAAYWPKTHRTGPAIGLAVGDVDAVIKAVQDAFEHAGVVANDSQFIRATMSKHIDRKFPRIEVEIGKVETP